MTFPEYHEVLVGGNASDLTASLERVIQSKVSASSVDQLELQEESSSWSNSASTQNLNVSLDYRVRGIEANQNGVSHVDVSWKSWALSSPIAIGTFEANRIGSYLFNGATQLASQPLSQVLENGNLVIRITLKVGTGLVSASDFPRDVAAMSILNFSQISTPVSTWRSSLDIASNRITWVKDFGMFSPITIYHSIVESGNSTRVAYALSYGLNAQISAPAGSTAQGDSIVVSFQGNPEELMAFIIVAVAAIGLVSFLFERRITPKAPKGRGKR